MEITISLKPPFGNYFLSGAPLKKGESIGSKKTNGISKDGGLAKANDALWNGG
jgi:hypothetical protein